MKSNHLKLRTTYLLRSFKIQFFIDIGKSEVHNDIYEEYKVDNIFKQTDETFIAEFKGNSNGCYE